MSRCVKLIMLMDDIILLRLDDDVQGASRMSRVCGDTCSARMS